MSRNGTLNWLKRGLLFTGFLLLLVMFIPQKVISQDGLDKPIVDHPLTGDPGSATPPDLVIDDPNADLGAAIAEASNISAQALASPIIISPASFIDANHNTHFRFTFSGYIYSASAGSSVCAGAPLDLPNGATIKGITAYAYDNDISQDIGLWLIKKDFKSGAVEIFLADFASSGANTLVRAFSDTTIVQPVVDNSKNIYSVYTCLRSPQHRLYAMQADYTLPTFLPAIQSN